MSSMLRTTASLLLTSAIALSAPALAQDSGDWDRARAAQMQGHDMATHQSIDRWRLLTASDRMGFGAYASFLMTYPGYPQEEKLRGFAEKALASESPDPSTLAAYFDRFPAMGSQAAGRQATALTSLRRADAAQKAVIAWRGGSLLPTDESALLAFYRDRLTTDDHDARMNALLWQGETSQAERQISFVSAARRAGFMERLSLLQGAAPGTLGVPTDPNLMRDPGYVYNRVVQARRNGNLPAAIGLLANRAPLNPLFDAGRLAVALNVGTLIQPTTRTQFLNKSVRLPPKLFSHNDQQSFFQASSPEGALSGWGGRIGDLFQSGNGSATLTCINTTGNAVFLTGRQAVQYNVGTGGPVSLLQGATSLYGSATAAQTLNRLMTETNPHVFANEHARVSKRALDTQAQIAGLLSGAPNTAFPLFPNGDSFVDQMRMVARMIAISGDLGTKRQVFFVSLGGFDLHDNLVATQPNLLRRLATAMRAFHDTTVAMGVADKVTTFTASDFGRTLTSNGNGSDHGWGSMHFVMGGAVKGKRLYGVAPAIGHNTPDDVGQGRLVPTMSVDQYAATLARWFGVSDGDLTTVLPNIGNYDRSTWSQGFL